MSKNISRRDFFIQSAGLISFTAILGTLVSCGISDGEKSANPLASQDVGKLMSDISQIDKYVSEYKTIELNQSLFINDKICYKVPASTAVAIIDGFDYALVIRWKNIDGQYICEPVKIQIEDVDNDYIVISCVTDIQLNIGDKLLLDSKKQTKMISSEFGIDKARLFFNRSRELN